MVGFLGLIGNKSWTYCVITVRLTGPLFLIISQVYYMCGLKLNTLNVRHWIFHPKWFYSEIANCLFSHFYRWQRNWNLKMKRIFLEVWNISNLGLRLKVLVITIQMLNALLNISVVACLPNIASPIRAISGWWILVTVCNYTQLSFLQTVRWKVSAIKHKEKLWIKTFWECQVLTIPH